MPFNVLAKHSPWAGSSSGVEYLTVELYDQDSNSKHLVFLSASFQAFVHADDAVDTLYDSNVDRVSPLPANQMTLIGGIFRVRTSVVDERVNAEITFEDGCSLSVYMQGDEYHDDRYRMHSVVLLPPDCYKCYSCGLCGDFKHVGGEMETCYGSIVSFEPGSSGDNAFAHDAHGNSWEKHFRDENCAISQMVPQSQYTPRVSEDFVYEAPACDESIREQVVATCQSAREYQV